MKYKNIYCILLFILLQLFITEISAKGRYNVTYGQLDTCQVYNIDNGGYDYRSFFYLHNLNNNKIGANERVHLKFYVITSKDAHILLSVNGHPRADDHVYEIVIGAGENTFSAIRTNMGRSRVATNQDPNLVSLYDPTPIEIVQTKDAELLVYIPGFKTEPLLRYTDTSPFNINYISFSSFGSTAARWFYDCEFDGFGQEIEAETSAISTEEKLISDLNLNGQNKSLPVNLSTVNFAFQVRSVALQRSGAILETRLHLIFYWQDKNLKWDPKDYGNITEVVRESLDIWTPDVIVLNAAFDSLGSLLTNAELKVHSNGSVVLVASNLELSTWCVDTARNWPHEQLECGINLGINEMNAANTRQISLRHDDTRPLSNEPVNTLSEWSFDEIAVSAIGEGKTMRYTAAGIRQAMVGDVAIEFRLNRNSDFYHNVFIMPILACQVFIILSFLLRGYRRGALVLIVFVLLLMGLMFISKCATPHYVPNLMIAYQHIVRIATFCYFLHIMIMWLELYPPKAKPPAFLFALINSAPLRLLLFLRISDVTEFKSIEEKPWTELAKFCNNFSFICINIAFIVIDVCLLPNV